MNVPFVAIQETGDKRCDVCGEITPPMTLDPTTNLRAGACCSAILLYAHRQLTIAFFMGGPRHPKAGEVNAVDNH